MRRGIDTLIAGLFALALVTAGVHAGHHDSLHVTAENETVSTTADTSVNLTFVVNNTADRPIQQGQLVIKNYSSALEPNRTGPINLGRLNASEERRILVEVSVPAKTPPGNYTLSLEVQEGNHTVDNATATVLVKTDESTTDTPNSGGSGTTTQTSENESDGAGIGPVGAGSHSDCHDVFGFTVCLDLPSLDDILGGIWSLIT